MTVTCTKHPKYPCPDICDGCRLAAQKAAELGNEAESVGETEAVTSATERGRIKREAIDGCYACDSHGYINGTVCAHSEVGRLAAGKGAALAREALNRAKEQR